MTFWRFLIIVGIICFSCNAVAKDTAKKSKKKPSMVHRSQAIHGKHSLVAEINRLLQGIDAKTIVGVHVKSMKYGDSLFTKNDYQLFIPASILKLVTAEAALLYLGPEYKFPTTFLTDAPQMSNGFINGNLYLVQTGDPSLTYYDLNDLLVALKSQQIQGIKGNVYFDTTAYDEVHYGPGWAWDDKRHCYAAPISASIINRNCVTFQIAPAKRVGGLANIIQSPRYFYGSIQNSVVTKAAGTKSCYLRMMNPANNPISVGGCMPKGHNIWGVSTVITDIKDYNRAILQNLFKRYGIQVKGNFEPGAGRPRLSTIAVHQSKPLHLLVNEMLKKSDNVIAGSLLKKMGEFHTKQPGSWENGSQAIKQILSKKASVNSTQMTIVDGSGLSRENKIQPAQLMQLLDFAYHNYGTNYEFISALPIAGIDGTLKNRLRNVSRKVRAKTGYIHGVVSLAGYAVTKDKEPLAFVIIVNGQNGKIWKYREVEDKIVTALTNYTRGA